MNETIVETPADSTAPEIAVRVRGLTKTYKIFDSSMQRALEPLLPRSKARLFTALDDVTIDVPAGEVLAILGKNGSGKSTLLKIITGVTTPTSGEVEVHGRISSMLELTSGFDLELSGMDNIYLRALALGIPKEEVEQRKQDIIEFADIGEHINQPVRTYSSGMKARLGFAVSVSVDPDILIVDEVLSVGDDIFKLKCIEKMEEFRLQGKTILFVSHSLFTVKAFCTLGMWINEGIVQAQGELGPVILEYEEFLKRARAKEREKLREAQSDSDAWMPIEKTDILQTSAFRMFNADDEAAQEFGFGEDVLFEFDYEVKRPIRMLTFNVTIRNTEDVEVYDGDKRSLGNVINSEVGKHKLTVRLKGLRLMPGEYFLSGELWNNDAAFFVGHSHKRPFKVTHDEYLGTGIAYVEHEFTND